MAAIDTGYLAQDFIDNVVVEVKLWNAAAVVDGGAANYFGATGAERIYGILPSHLTTGGELLPNIKEPTILISWSSKDGNLRQPTAAQCGANHTYVALLAANISLAWTGPKDATIANARKYGVSLSEWLEEHNANGYCHYVQSSSIVPITPEVSLILGGWAGVAFRYTGERDVELTLQYTT
ncbi:hypothetical protein ES703_07979 [subsurface metagenome]